MPLDRDHITQASRVMLPTYVIVFGLLGILFLFQSPSRTSGEAFDSAKVVLSIPHWGIVFAAVALIELAAMVAHRRRMYMVGLVIGVGLVAFWTVVLLMAAVASPVVSFTSAVWVGGWIAAHAATGRSLAVGER